MKLINAKYRRIVWIFLLTFSFFDSVNAACNCATEYEYLFSCYPCPAGKQGQGYHCNGINTCNDCAQGQYGSDGSCKSCAHGQYQNGYGASSCKSCPAGQYQDQNGRTDCKNCPVGQYQNQAWMTWCPNCPAGQYQDQNGQSSCKNCLIGQYSGTKSKSCDNCGGGKYSLGNGKSTCEDCPSGQYQNQVAKTDCKNCPSGRYRNQAGGIVCDICGSGTYSSADGKSCKSCEIGRYILWGGNACQDCPSGWYTSTVGSLSCSWCDPGMYQDLTRQSECKNCPSGQYQLSGRTSSCVQCYVGRYQNIQRQTTCKDCDAGKFNNKMGQSSCFNCPQGRFAEAAGFRTAHGNCDPCETGKYGHLVGSLVVPTSSAIACKNCPQGFSQSSLGMTDCEKCAQHLYQDQEGQISCKGCPSGKFSYLNVVCKDCPQGYWRDAAKSNVCKLCSPGRYSTSSGLSGECPQWCGPGQEQTSLATSCQDCDVAKFRTNEKDPMNCIQCVAGKYQDQEGQPLCKNCMVGKYLPPLSIDEHDSPEDCKMCLVGRYAKITGKNECDICTSPSYQDEVGQSQCKICVAGKIRTVSTGCTDCVTGKHQNEPGKNICKQCPIGYKSDVLGLAQCLQCGNGQYTDTKGQSTCNKCPWRGACQHLTTIHPKTRIGVVGPWYDRKPFVGTRLTLKTMIEKGQNATQTNKRLYDRVNLMTIGVNDPYKNVQSSCPDITTKNILETECRDIHWTTGSAVDNDVETNRRHVSSRNIFWEAIECPIESKIYDEETCRLGGGTPGYAITNMDFYNPYNRLFYKCEQFADDQITEPGPYKNRGAPFAQQLVDQCNNGRSGHACDTGTNWEKTACEWGKKLRVVLSYMHKCYNGHKEVCRKKQFYKSANYFRSENICQNKVDSFDDCKEAATELGLVFGSKYKEITEDNCRYPITSKEECEVAYEQRGEPVDETVTFEGNVCSKLASFMCRDEGVPNGCIMHEDGHVTYNVDNSTSERTQEDFCTYETGKECICKSDGLDRSQCAYATGLQLADLTKKEDYGTYYRSAEICSPSDSFDNAQECKVAAEWITQNRPIVQGLTDIVVSLNTDTIVDCPLYKIKTSGKCTDDEGWAYIETVDECAAAGAGMGYFDVKEGEYDHSPKGCYRSSDADLYLNIHTSDASCGDSACICKTVCQNDSKPSGCFLEETHFYWNNQKSSEVCGDGGCVCKRNDLPKGCSSYNGKSYWSDNSNENHKSKYTKVDIIPTSNFVKTNGSHCYTGGFGILPPGAEKLCLFN